MFHPLRKNLLTIKPTISGITEALVAGVDPNTANKYNETALFYTTADYDTGVEATDNYIMTGLLLEEGANPNVYNIDGDTPLINAIRASDLNPEYNDIVKLLIEEGNADVFMKCKNYEQDEEGMFPIDIALKYNNTELVNIISRHMDFHKAKKRLAVAKSLHHRLGEGSVVGDIDPLTLAELFNKKENYEEILELREAKKRLAVAKSLHHRLGEGSVVGDIDPLTLAELFNKKGGGKRKKTKKKNQRGGTRKKKKTKKKKKKKKKKNKRVD